MGCDMYIYMYLIVFGIGAIGVLPVGAVAIFPALAISKLIGDKVCGAKQGGAN